MPPDDYSYTGIENANDVLKDISIEPSDLETIDFAFYDFINEKMDIRTKTNKGWKKVPIIWSSPERAFFTKEKKELYDLDGTLIYPIISIERAAINKDLTKKGKYYGAAPFMIGPNRGGRIMVGRRIVQDKTNNFSVADNRKKFGSVNRSPGRQSYYPKVGKKNKKIVTETLYIPQPVYVDIKYDIVLNSNYQQQMNQMLQPFTTLGGHINSFIIERAGHSYEVFMKTIAQETNLAQYKDEERNYKTKISFDVLGYVIGEGENQKRPKIIKRENAVEVKIPRERVIMGDTQQFDPNSDFYRD
jgi:hypothetical protein